MGVWGLWKSIKVIWHFFDKTAMQYSCSTCSVRHYKPIHTCLWVDCVL